jgi:hypothetical protein
VGEGGVKEAIYISLKKKQMSAFLKWTPSIQGRFDGEKRLELFL